MLGKTVGHSIGRASVRKGVHTPVANTAAIVTVALTASKTTTVHGCQWSYSTSPTAGRLTIVTASTTILDLDITGAGPGGFNFMIPGGAGEAVVITLAAGSGACVGKLNVQYSIEDSDNY